MGEDLRIGVWVCECGGNIGDVVEVPRVAKSLRGEVAYVNQERYLCSSPSIENFKDMVEKRNLDRVILACCTPNMHWETFKDGKREVEAVEVDHEAGAAAVLEAGGEGHRRQIADFIESIREDREPAVNGEEGRRSLAAVRAIYDAASSRQEVAVR